MKKKLLLLLIFLLAVCVGYGQTRFVILHTNDVHSQIEPTLSDSGGMVRMASYIGEVRAAEKNVILLSAGDFFQGTPYFNLFFGKVEIELMNAVRYDAACLGNHEFDCGIDTLANRLREAHFPILVANYNVEQTPLQNIVKPYTIIEKDGIKIGITGVGIELQTWSFDHLWRGMSISNPIVAANKIAEILKKREHCDVIICLSHMGDKKDFELAEKSSDIDIIIGGHTHRKIHGICKNINNKDVTVVQAGKSGFFVGRIDVVIE